MAYPSIVTQTGGCASCQAHHRLYLLPSASASFTRPLRILEIGSGSYEHISSFAEKWPNVQWVGTVRNEDEQSNVMKKTSEKLSPPPNLTSRPATLDVDNESDWKNLARAVRNEGAFEGVLFINVIHCMPADHPERIFERLSPTLDGPLLNPTTGWIATYGPFLDDDGEYKSPEDADVRYQTLSALNQFDAGYIRAKDASLGLRSIKNISEIAWKNGFYEAERRELPKGNMWVVWRPKRDR